MAEGQQLGGSFADMVDQTSQCGTNDFASKVSSIIGRGSYGQKVVLEVSCCHDGGDMVAPFAFS